MTTPTPGRIVLYTVNQDDADQINKRRSDFVEHRRGESYEDTGHVAHVGNQVREGDVFPAVVIRVWGPGSVTPSANLHVLLDGVDTFWATSVSEGKGPKSWSWPPRV